MHEPGERQRLTPLQFGHEANAPEEEEGDHDQIPDEQEMKRRSLRNRVNPQRDPPDEQRDRQEDRADAHDRHQHGVDAAGPAPLIRQQTPA